MTFLVGSLLFLHASGLLGLRPNPGISALRQWHDQAGPARRRFERPWNLRRPAGALAEEVDVSNKANSEEVPSSQCQVSSGRSRRSGLQTSHSTLYTLHSSHAFVRNKANSGHGRSESKCLRKGLMANQVRRRLGKTKPISGWTARVKAGQTAGAAGRASVRNEPNSRMRDGLPRRGRNWLRLCGGVASGGKRLRWRADGTCGATLDKSTDEP